MVKPKSPSRFKSFQGRLSALFDLVKFEVKRSELDDVNRLITIDLKKRESIALLDVNGDFWQLRRAKNGQYTITKLTNKGKTRTKPHSLEQLE